MKKTKVIMPIHCSSDNCKFFMEDAVLVDSIEWLDFLTDNELSQEELKERFNNRNLSILYIYECYEWFVFFKEDKEWNYQTYYLTEYSVC